MKIQDVKTVAGQAGAVRGVLGHKMRLGAPDATGRRMPEVIEGSRYVEVPRSGHLINIEEASLFDEAVLAFLLANSG